MRRKPNQGQGRIAKQAEESRGYTVGLCIITDDGKSKYCAAGVLEVNFFVYIPGLLNAY